MPQNHFLPYVIAFLVSLGLAWGLRPMARHIGLVDHPGGRKDHNGQVPLVGGIAMFCGFFFAVLVIDVGLGKYKPLFAGSALLLIVGIMDDLHELGPRMRLLAQVMAGLFMTAWGENSLSNLGALLGTGEIVLGVFSIPFTVFCVVGVINAFNMSDGADGLAGSLALVATLAMALVSWNAGSTVETALLLVLAITIVSFLLLNYRFPGRNMALVFMGDAGSMFLGFVLVWFLIDLSQRPAAAIAPVTALWLVALPLIDTVSIMLRRILKGRSPFLPDREHLHHILLAAGYSVSQTVTIIVALSVLLAAIGLMGAHLDVPEVVMFSGFMLLFAGYFWAMKHAWKLKRLLPHMKRGNG